MAVFTPVSETQAAAFLDQYAVGTLERLTPISEGVENTNYKLRADATDYVLTLYEKRVRTEDLPFILGLTSHLADRGYPAPRPITDRSGAVLGRLNDRAAALIEWKTGAWKPTRALADTKTAGASLARLHVLSASVAGGPPNHFGPKAWRDLFNTCGAAKDAGDWASMLRVLGDELDALEAAWPADLPSGPIHGDFFPDNVLYTEGEITGVIDYYFAGVDSWAYDVAIGVNAWCFDANGAFQPEHAEAFCAGYDSERRFTPQERAALPLLCRGAAVRFTLSRLHDVLHHNPDWLVTPKDPQPFFARLAVHQAAQDAGAYGLAPAA